MIDVACVCVGDKYDPALYVDQLYKGLCKQLNEDFNLTVLTDTPNNPFYNTIPCRTVQVPDWKGLYGPRAAWWFKMYLYSPDAGFTGTVLYFDLDVILLKNIDKFLTHEPGGFVLCHDFNRKWIPSYNVSNSSVMRWFAPHYFHIWEEFNKARDEFIAKFHGDQDFMTHYFKDRDDKSWWPHDWAMSWKWEIYRGGLIQSGTGLNDDGTWPAAPEKYHQPEQPWIIPHDCSVVVFHGEPKPWDTELGKQNLL